MVCCIQERCYFGERWSLHRQQAPPYYYYPTYLRGVVWLTAEKGGRGGRICVAAFVSIIALRSCICWLINKIEDNFVRFLNFNHFHALIPVLQLLKIDLTMAGQRCCFSGSTSLIKAEAVADNSD